MAQNDDFGELIDGAPFIYRDVPGLVSDAPTIVALHGSGTDETTVIPLARGISPSARIIAPRGRVYQNGERRWFRKITPTSFDQASIREEAAAFAAFLETMRACGVLGASQSPLFLGYSNGGNLVSSVMLLHPGLIGRAVLLRCMPVLSRAPMTDLTGSEVLVIGGSQDQTYGPQARRLADLLRRRGAHVRARTVDAGHLFGDADVAAVQRWRDRA